MALTQTWTNQTAKAVSTGAGHAGTVSGNQIASFSGDFSNGSVWIEASFDAGSTWQAVPNTMRQHPDIFGLICPDTAVEYRFACISIFGTVNCYMGP